MEAGAVRAACAELGSLARVVADPPDTLPESARQFLRSPPRTAVEADLAWITRSGARLVPCTSSIYPPLLAAVSDAPAVLYVLGDAAVLARSQLAMVGARAATP